MGLPRLDGWVDTCVMLDFETTMSMFRNMRAGDACIEDTRKQMLRAAWLAVALDELRFVSVTLGHEHKRLLDKHALPNTVRGVWTHLVMGYVRERMFPGWVSVWTDDGEFDAAGRTLDNDERDEFMYENAKSIGKPFITSDDRAFKRAKRAGVNAFKPEEFAARVIAFDAASLRFHARLAGMLSRYAQEEPNRRRVRLFSTALCNTYDSLWRWSEGGLASPFDVALRWLKRNQPA